MNWFVLAVCSGFFFALTKVITRVALRKKGNPMAFFGLQDIIAGIFLLPFISLELPTGFVPWAFCLGMIVSVFIADYTATVALQKIDVSLFQIITQLRHVLILVVGLLLFAEPLTLYKTLAIVVIIVGVLVTVYDKKKCFLSEGVYYSLLSTIGAVALFTFSKYSLDYFQVFTLAAIALISGGLMSTVFLKFQMSKFVQELKMHKVALVSSGLAFALFELCLFSALRIGEISKVVPVNESALVFAVLIGIIFLHERKNMEWKILGTAIVILGISFMYLL